MRDNKGVGAEYLPNVESYILPAMERQEAMGFIERRFENDTFILYELTDPAPQDRPTLLVDSSWTEYLGLVWNRLDLSRCYDFEYLPYHRPDEADTAQPLLLYTQDPGSASVDLWAIEREGVFFTPSPKIFPFNSDVVASSYYLSPMFRLFLFFSNTKWNRTEVITPGLFGTLRGSFLAVPRSTDLTIPVTIPETGRYRILLRGAMTGNAVTVDAPSIGYLRSLELRSSDDALQFFTEETVYTPGRVPVEAGGASVGELEKAIDEGLVPVNVRYEYQDLGVVEASTGTHGFRIAKHDANPMLIEGIVVIPEDVYRSLSFDSRVQIVDSPADLDCGTTYEVFGRESEGYIDPAANGPHADLSNEELLSLAAAGVAGIEPDETGGLGGNRLILLLTIALLVAASMAVRSRTRPRDDEQPPATAVIDDHEPDPKGTGGTDA